MEFKLAPKGRRARNLLASVLAGAALTSGAMTVPSEAGAKTPPPITATGKATLNNLSETDWVMHETNELAKKIEQDGGQKLIVIDSRKLPVGKGSLLMWGALKDEINKQGVNLAPDLMNELINLDFIAQHIDKHGPWGAFTPKDKKQARVVISGYKGDDPDDFVGVFAGFKTAPSVFENYDVRKLGVSRAIFDADRLGAFVAEHENGHLDQEKYLTPLSRDAEPIRVLMYEHHKEAKADSYAAIMRAAQGDMEIAKDASKLREVYCLKAGQQMSLTAQDDEKLGWLPYNNGRVLNHTARLMEKIGNKEWGAVDKELMRTFKSYHNAQNTNANDPHLKAYSDKEDIMRQLKTTGMMGLRKDRDTVHRISAAMATHYGMSEAELKATALYVPSAGVCFFNNWSFDPLEIAAAGLKAQFHENMTEGQKEYLRGLQKNVDDVLAPALGGDAKQELQSDAQRAMEARMNERAEKLKQSLKAADKGPKAQL